MTPSQTYNEDQRARWNGADGEYWVRQQELLDRKLAPVLAPLLAFAEPRPGSTVIDIGCGCGATTLELARAVGPSGRVMGVDLSAPMVARARARLRDFPGTSFRVGDAGALALSDIHAELMISRFGVMFFGDAAAAFANLRTALAPGGRLRFACWRPIHENPWLQIPLHAVYEHAPRLPKPAPDEPGPFSLADPARVTRVLTEAGFAAPNLTPLDVEIDLAAGGTFEDAVALSSDMGPAKRALEGESEEVRAAGRESIRTALKTSGVKLAAAVWLVAAERRDQS